MLFVNKFNLQLNDNFVGREQCYIQNFDNLKAEITMKC